MGLERGDRGGGKGEDNQSQYGESSLCSKFRDGGEEGEGVKGKAVYLGWGGGGSSVG